MRFSIIQTSLAFVFITFIANAQQRESNALTDKEVREMTWVEAMQDYRVNFNTVVDKFNKAHRGVPYEKGHGIKQFRRWEYMMGQRVDENGVRPHPGLLYQAIQSQNNQSSVEYGDWSSMGPFDAPSNGGIGRINNVAFHPKHNDTIYAGAPAGGLWVSYDDGQSWQTFTDELTNIGVSDLAIDPEHPDTMYLATGDRDAADTYSFGLLKSTDGGVTWSSTGLSFNVNQYYRIGRVTVDPDSTNIVLVATNGGIYRSLNYGANFTLEQTGSFFGVHQGNGDTAYATTTGSSPKVYRSVNAGDTWQQLTNGLPTSGKYRCELALSTTPGTLYVVYGDSNYGYGGVYRSTNGGNNWTLMSTTPNIMGWSNVGSGTGGQAWYDLSIACDPNSENTIYVGGVNIWKSTNGGSTWSIVGHWYGAGSTPYVHADHHHAIFRPNTSQLYVGTDGGVYKSTNGGSSWSHLNDGMNITQYYKISQSTSDSAVVLAGAQDNGSHLRSSTYNWSEVTGGDGMDNGVDAVNDNLMYTSIYYGSFYKSTNGGSFFSSINTLSASGSGNWVTPFQVDPVTTNTAYAGFKKLWKTTNAGASWSATSTNNVNGNSNIDEFEIAPSNTNYIYVLINQGVYKSTNGGSTWSTITPSGTLSPGANVLGIAVDPDDEDHIAIAISGFNSNKKAMESFNGGQTWTNISSGLPNVPATAVVFEGNNSDGIYVGTDIGVYYKSSTYPSWVSFNKNLPNVIISDLEVYEDDALLRIGTYGRGVWQSPLMLGLSTAPVAAFSADPVSTCGLGDTVQLTDNSSGQPTSWYWQITPSTYNFVGGTSDSSQFPEIIFTATGNYTVTLTASNNYGTDDTTQFQAISVGGATLPFVEDFENGLSGWEINNPDNSTTWSITTVGGTSPGSNAMMLDHYAYSTSGAVDELISPPLDFSNDTLVTLSFEYASAYYSANYFDSLKVYVSDDCGTSWSELAAWSSKNTSFSTAGAITSSFVPNNASKWCHGATGISCPSIDLDAYSGMSGVKIKFVAINGYGNNMFIDNINISGEPLIASFSSDSVSCPGSSITFYDNSSPTSTSRTWYFPGGSPSTSTALSPVVTYSSSGYYDVTLVASYGLYSDSITEVDFITINNTATGNDVISACGSYTWIDGNTYTASNNTATYVLTGANGCDSTVTLNLTINNTATGNDVISACGSYTWIDGNTYTASNNTATYVLTGANGCDSTVTLNLTINNTATGNEVISACGSYTWIDGNTYTASNNTATYVLTGANGCDSTVTLNLTINNTATGNDVISACGSYTWIDGNTYTASNNTATYVLTGANGCDSTVTLNLTINNTATGNDVISACGSYTWIDGNTYTASNNTATYVLTGANGCDSTVTLNLTINNTATGNDVISACGSYTWIDGNTYTASNNTATYVLTGANGCDSTVTLNLTINNTATGNDVISACGSYTWIDGNTYTASNNTATYVLTGANGCDSTVTLNLTINNTATGNDVISACGSYTWIDGNTYTASNNTATYVLTGANGCDSTVTLNLTINNTATGNDVISACGSYTWIDGNTYTASNNTATYVLTGANGCDSTVTLNLTINNISTTITYSNDTLYVAPNQSFYQWGICQNGVLSPIAGMSNYYFVPQNSGDYAVIVQNGTCTDTSECVSYSSLGENENRQAFIQVYPNPTTGIIQIKGLHANSIINIYSVQGEIIESFIGVNTKELNLDITHFKSGVYVLSIEGRERISNYILIKI